jgi:hypothetical protein
MRNDYAKNRESTEKKMYNNKDFRALLGLLMQLIDVRLELNYPLSKIAQYTEVATDYDYEALIHMVRYLYGTQDIKLCFKPNSDTAKTYVKFRAYADAAYSVSEDGRSQYASCYDIICTNTNDGNNLEYENSGSAMFHLRSVLAKCTDLGTCAAETGAVLETTKDVVLLRGILQEMGHPQLFPTPIYNDNQSAIALTTAYSGNHKRIRFMLPKINWLLEQTKSHVIQMRYMNSKELPADLGTKQIASGGEFGQKRNRVLGWTDAVEPGSG